MSEENINGFVSHDQWITPGKREYNEKTFEGFGRVRFRSLMAGEKSSYDSVAYSKKGELIPARVADADRRLIALTVVDDDGNLILNQPGDLTALANKDAKLIDEIYRTIAEHCGMLPVVSVTETAKN